MKFNKIITALAFSLTLGSCDFLDTVPQDFVAPENFFKNQDEAFMSLTTVFITIEQPKLIRNIRV